MKKIYEIIMDAVLTAIDHDDYYMDHVEDVVWGLCSIYSKHGYMSNDDAYNYLDESVLFNPRILRIIDSEIYKLLSYESKVIK